MSNAKISALTAAASADGNQAHVIVSGGTNKKITQATMRKGVACYVEGTCRATATVAMLPQCNIFDMYIKVLVGSSANAGGSNVNIGIGTRAQYFVGNAATSGPNFYRPGDQYSVFSFNSAAHFQNFSGAVVAAAPTASANASFVVGIGYFT